MAASRARIGLSLCSRIARSRTISSTRTLLLDKNRLTRPISAVTTSDFASFVGKRINSVQFTTTSIISAIDSNTVVEDPESRPSSTGGGVSVTESEDDDDPFMQEQIRRYERCRRWLAAIMGKHVENFTDKDVQEAIDYLMPSSLYAKDARPQLVHPSELFKKSRGQLFDATGRPSSAAFYTGRIGYHDLLYDIFQQFEKLDDARLGAKSESESMEINKTAKLSEENDGDEKEEKERQNERPMRWIKKTELENMLEETLDDREYEVVLYRLKKLAAQPDAYLVYDFIKKYIFPVFTPGMKQVSLQVDEEGRAHGIGHRKRAIAEVWVKKGSGEVAINGMPLVQYLGRMEDRKQILFPFQVVDGVGHYDAECNVIGGGPAGQAGAIRLAISRALLNFSAEFQQPLLDAGLLIRDPRIVERKKPGQKKARKKFAWVKR